MERQIVDYSENYLLEYMNKVVPTNNDELVQEVPCNCPKCQEQNNQNISVVYSYDNPQPIKPIKANAYAEGEINREPPQTVPPEQIKVMSAPANDLPKTPPEVVKATPITQKVEPKEEESIVPLVIGIAVLGTCIALSGNPQETPKPTKELKEELKGIDKKGQKGQKTTNHKKHSFK